jgi:uncharacterized protein YrzB (UPF0473 family)
MRDEKLSNTEKEQNCSHADGHDHEHHQIIAIEFDDGTELDCPVLDVFEVNGQEYIALIHPVEETALLYRFFDNEDGTLDLTSIEDDAEYEVVSETFMSLLEDEE